MFLVISCSCKTNGRCWRDDNFTGKKKKGMGWWGQGKEKAPFEILEVMPLFGTIAQQMCKGNFLYSQDSGKFRGFIICKWSVPLFLLVLNWCLDFKDLWFWMYFYESKFILSAADSRGLEWKRICLERPVWNAAISRNKMDQTVLLKDGRGSCLFLS